MLFLQSGEVPWMYSIIRWWIDLRMPLYIEVVFLGQNRNLVYRVLDKPCFLSIYIALRGILL